MTTVEKQSMLAEMLGIAPNDGEYSRLLTYLSFSQKAIIDHYYRNVGIPDGATVPEHYEMVQIESCIVGLNLQGAENQVIHNENGISRQFDYPSMVKYIEARVHPLVRIV